MLSGSSAKTGSGGPASGLGEVWVLWVMCVCAPRGASTSGKPSLHFTLGPGTGPTLIHVKRSTRARSCGDCGAESRMLLRGSRQQPVAESDQARGAAAVLDLARGERVG